MAHDGTKRYAFGWSADPAKLLGVEVHGFVAQRLPEDISAVPDPHEQTVRFSAIL